MAAVYVAFSHTSNLLFWDHWDFYKPLFSDGFPGLWTLFSWQHGPHRQGLGFLLQAGVDWLSGWDTRWVGFAIVICMAAAAEVFTAVRNRMFGKGAPNLVLMLLLLSPLQVQLFAATPNLSHGAVPVLLLSLYCLILLMKQNEWVRMLLLVLININLLFTGFGFFMGLISLPVFGVEVYLRHKEKGSSGWHPPLAGLVLSLLSLVLFFTNYRFITSNPNFQFPHPRPWEYLSFMANGMGNLLGLKGGGPLTVLGGGALLCILAVVAWKNFRRVLNGGEAFRWVILVLILFSLLFLANTAIGRVSFGVHTARASRYVPYLIPALVGLYFHLLGWETRYRGLLITGLFAGVLFGALRSGRELEAMHRLSEQKEKWAEVYRESHRVERADSISGIRIHPDPEKTHLQEKLDYLENRRLNLFKPQKQP